MAFVPVVVPPQRSASARAQDLGRRLKAEVERFETQYPGTSRDDLRAAAAIAIGEESVRVPPRRRVAALLGAGLGVLGALGFLIEARAGDGGESTPWPLIGIVIAAGCVAILAAVVRRSRR